MTDPLENHIPAQNEALSVKTVAGHLSKFCLTLLGSAVLCLSGYALTVDQLIQTSDIPATYKWFLLKEAPGPRIIFESGSNSHYAIDTDAVGAALGMTAINIADNAGYAIEDKITRLETYTRPGDVVILPLEWSFYYRDKLTDDYVDTLFSSGSDYYRSMPPIKRIKRALSLPPATVISVIKKTKKVSESDVESPARALFVSALKQPSGHKSREVSSGPGPGVAEQSCDDYVFGKEVERREPKLGARIKPALKRLKKLQKQNVNIHFAWPVLAGTGCLSDPVYMAGFRKEIEDAVNASGFEFLGTINQSLYSQDFQDDTPYHLTTAGTKAHTQKMIGFLQAQGYGGNTIAPDIKTFVRHRLLELELAQVKAIIQPALPISEPVDLGSPTSRDSVEFTAGWWGFEPYGRWMRDNRSMFRVTLPESLDEDAVLKINGITKSGNAERVTVTANGNLIASQFFSQSSPLLIPISQLPRGEAVSIFLNLPEAIVPKSPLERGESEDARSMTLHFQAITVSRENTPQELTASKEIDVNLVETSYMPSTHD